MPSKMRTDKVTETIGPIVTKVANDPEVREHALKALDSAKSVYARVQSDGARSAATRKDVQDEVVRAANELKAGAQRLTEPPRKKSRTFLKFIVGLGIAALAVVGIKKAMSSDEDEFEYTP